MHDYISNLDSELFGFPVAKIFSNIENPELVVRELKKKSTKLIIARIDLSKTKLINQLERLGFLYKDAQVTFNYNVQKKLPENQFNSFSIVPYTEKHLLELIDITKISFNNYGHYFADKRLNLKSSLDTYGDWTYNSCVNKNVADKVFVAEIDDEILGFLSFKTFNSREGTYAAGGLGAVNPKHRSIGVFQNISIFGLEWGVEMGFDWEEHNVLVNNYPVNKSFLNIGFRPNKSMVTLHGWIDELKNKI